MYKTPFQWSVYGFEFNLKKVVKVRIEELLTIHRYINKYNIKLLIKVPTYQMLEYSNDSLCILREFPHIKCLNTVTIVYVV